MSVQYARHLSLAAVMLTGFAQATLASAEQPEEVYEACAKLPDDL